MAESPEDTNVQSDEDMKELETNVLDATERFMSKKTPNISEAEMIPYVFGNNPNNPVPFGLLDMFYSGVFRNVIGIMTSMDKETGKEVNLLVGLSKDEAGELQVFPMALCIGEEETKRYLPPDGNGGYVGLGE